MFYFLVNSNHHQDSAKQVLGIQFNKWAKQTSEVKLLTIITWLISNRAKVEPRSVVSKAY